MRITVLTDNNTYIDQYYLGEPALSFYIEADGKRILFDTGYSQVFIKNAKDMGITFDHLDTLVISHGHNDHTGGLSYLLEELEQYEQRKGLEKPLPVRDCIAHLDMLAKRYDNTIDISPKVTKKELQKYFNLKLTKEVIPLTNHLYFLGEIPRTNDFEAKCPVGIRLVENEEFEDFVMDDTALAYRGEEGIYIITGCSHAGICNIIDYAKEVMKEENVLGVIGGFHLFEYNNQTKSTIDYLKQQNIPFLYPCHCTSLKVKAEMMKEMDIKEVGVGLALDWK